MSASGYPVHADAELDLRLSRWMWLVKWLLVIPHYVVLAFLWVAFVALSIVAFFAILVTGRYPRSIFDFNVGVLRWTWRVAYYAYGALGTDRYPPFSLADEPDYPARLQVDYPEQLSRGLVLVKSWLLAVPHYLVLALFLGGAGFAIGWPNGRSDEPLLWTTGLLGVLVMVAAVVLLFTGRYPTSVFDLVLGINRWVLRVAAYAALMTDQYPPFRLDQGGHEPATTLLTPGPPTTLAEPLPSEPRWGAGRVVGIVLASIVALGSLGVAAGGGALAIADQTMRDADGFLMTGDETLVTDTYALVSTSMVLETEATVDGLPEELVGDVKLTAAPTGDQDLFLGIAPTADVERYLGAVRHDTVTDLAPDTTYVTSGSEAPTAAPGDLDIWVAQASGVGEQTITWEPADGSWTVVVMDADGRAGLEAGAEVPAMDWLVPLLLSAGLTGLVLGAAVLVGLARGARKGRQA